MKNRNIYIATTIRSSIIFIFLLVIISKNKDIMSRIIILPFLLCSLFLALKNICLIMDKERIALTFSKLFIINFLVFWFGFLVFSNAYFIRENNYFSLIFTIPFWIAGIYMVHKFLFSANPKKMTRQKESRFNFQMVVSSFLVLSVLGVGIASLFFGIRNTYKLKVKTKGYLTTNGYFKDYSIYNINKDKTTYKLIYIYEVNGKEYTIVTDYGVGAESIPEINNKREIKYNSANPAEAVLSGTNKNNFLIYFGMFFTLGGSIFVLFALSLKGVFDKVKFNIIGTYIGVMCIIVGIGIILLQNGTTLSLLGTIKSLKIWIVIPILFIVSGIYLMIKSLFFENMNR